MRKHGTCLLTCILITAGTMAETTESTLPYWGKDEHAKSETEGWIAGNVLLTQDPIPDESENAEEPQNLTINVVESPAKQIGKSQPTPDPIPEKFWLEYFGQKPKSFLIDPQGLLTSSDYENRKAFLNYHAGDSAIDLYVYVFKGGQELPSEVREEELIERFFNEGRPAVVVYYYMAEPQLSTIYLSPSLTDVIPSAEQQCALESSIIQSSAKPDPSSQLEAFLVQMSIRIYWMEQKAGLDNQQKQSMKSSTSRKKADVKKSKLLALLGPWIEKAKPMILPSVILIASLLAGLSTTWCLRRRARYYFPEFEVEPRLGGAHAAGIGAVISFVSASVPPASQREQG